MTTMQVLAELGKFAEFALTVVFALAITVGIVFLIGAWMQSNPTLQARRQQAAAVETRNRIARERAVLNANATVQKRFYR